MITGKFSISISKRTLFSKEKRFSWVFAGIVNSTHLFTPLSASILRTSWNKEFERIFGLEIIYRWISSTALTYLKLRRQELLLLCPCYNFRFGCENYCWNIFSPPAVHLFKRDVDTQSITSKLTVRYLYLSHITFVLSHLGKYTLFLFCQLLTLFHAFFLNFYLKIANHGLLVISLKMFFCFVSAVGD